MKLKVKVKVFGERAQWVPVSDYAEASRKVREFINRTGIGGSVWEGGEVRNDTNNVVANVSYNGRVWAPGHWSTETELFYEPGQSTAVRK